MITVLKYKRYLGIIPDIQHRDIIYMYMYNTEITFNCNIPSTCTIMIVIFSEMSLL